MERIRRLGMREENHREVARHIELDPEDAELAAELIARANGFMRLRISLLHRNGMWWLPGGDD